ncbi:ribokinase [Actinoplanes capillaceus]|uniref:Ribokinase n=1 Tax=Actinoplanes campanulatus TaxID=113559 RepID=A0ABQ3WZA0_9ACTN|nr:PfkB family carbohydrate kinase [Actinoplanes capillaceus]GID51503.1 ribokinase [Actinoplanes capillaceus]
MTTPTSPAAPSDVTIIGRANIDLTVQVPYHPSLGAHQTVFGSELVATAGGKSLNQAIAVARLGGRVGLVANAGEDHWGHQLKTTLAEAGVEIDHFQLLPGAPTGSAIIEVTPDGENVIVLAVSPKTELTVEHVRVALTRTASPVVVVQLDLPPEPVVTALTDARQPVIRVGNLVPHPSLDPDWLRYLDILVVNQVEAATILGITGVVDPLTAANQLRSLGPPTVVVTAGAAGASYSHAEHAGIVAAPTVPVVDTTGAGDALLAGLVLALIAGSALPDAVAQAVRAGTAAVQHEGAHLPRSVARRRTW